MTGGFPLEKIISFLKEKNERNAQKLLKEGDENEQEIITLDSVGFNDVYICN